MNILLIYHFFHPDQVISSQIFSGLAEELVKAGHRVCVFTGNRLIRGSDVLTPHEVWHGVDIRRFRRPAFSQGSNFGRLFNSAILQIKWLAAFWRRRREFDAVIVGTDPQFAYLMFPFLRLMNRRAKLVHWAFDLYPEAIMVDSAPWMRMLATLTRPLPSWAYRRVDLMADLGSCMRERLLKHRHRAVCETLTPWALVEPERIPSPDPEIRQKLFGDAKIGLLYSGTVGYAHELGTFIKLARECRRRGIAAAFCFAGYGNRYRQETAGITAEDTNIRLLDFASEEELAKRLAAADIHLISLRPGWEGIVVPSKFFAALAIGRPVVFSGPDNSCVSRWIDQEKLGATIGDRIDEAVSFLERTAHSPELLREYRERAWRTYRNMFSKAVICSRWNALLAPGPSNHQNEPAGNNSAE